MCAFSISPGTNLHFGEQKEVTGSPIWQVGMMESDDFVVAGEKRVRFQCTLFRLVMLGGVSATLSSIATIPSDTKLLHFQVSFFNSFHLSVNLHLFLDWVAPVRLQTTQQVASAFEVFFL